MNKTKFTEEDEALLEELGVEVETKKNSSLTVREERIIAGFEEIQRFAEKHGHAPQHGEDRDIFERLYAVRLDRLRALEECRNLLLPLDHQRLLNGGEVASFDPIDTMSDDELLAELGSATDNDITDLRHVRSRTEIRAAEEIASREKCEDFDRFRPLFEEAESGLKAGAWITKPFGKDASIELGDFFILAGQIAYVAEKHKSAPTKDGRDNPRLRVIFNNQTESDLLLRSLSRSLYPDGNTPVGRRLIKVDHGPLFGKTKEPDAPPLFSETREADDIESGTIYVLRSFSAHPFVTEHRELIHKIGVTGSKAETRIANAAHDATYLLADVEVVATYKLVGINRVKLENLIHRIFAPAQLDLTIQDRFGRPVQPREWFLVPLHVIDEVVQRIRDKSITGLIYDPKTACLIKPI
ncbi:MAG: GIY-YIG nuclease family protein [Burkholderiales bacterium]|jgi:hypothetical protein|nr:GIY-YIG nuclease family protein [Burkholderiales bacterium]